MTETWPDSPAEEWADDAYWIHHGRFLYRRWGMKRQGDGVGLQRWDRVTRQWVDSVEWYGDMIDGDMTYNDLTVEQARKKFPAAFTDPEEH